MLLVICVVSTSLMSFKTDEEPLYGMSYQIHEVTTNRGVAESQRVRAAVARTAVRVTVKVSRKVVAATKKAVAFVQAVVQVSLPGVAHTIRTASTLAHENMESHRQKYQVDINNLKMQKIRSLG
ncbi:hypothetical protein ABW636_04170 [Aquimarina sp. 2201CG1-2-11]|uniref:hypothetical protein n=1 Tax=Aquimarina discodermiae TaxID=3231043 RepID=UPI003461A271